MLLAFHAAEQILCFLAPVENPLKPTDSHDLCVRACVRLRETDLKDKSSFLHRYFLTELPFILAREIDW